MRLKRHVSLEIARLVWGNDAWTANNRAGREALRAARTAARAAGECTAAGTGLDLAERVDRLGYAVFDPGYDAELVTEIQRGYEKVIDTPERTLDMGRLLPGVVRYVRDPVGAVPALRELVTPAVRDALDAFYGRRWRIEHVRMWRISHLPPHERGTQHYGNLWHCDHHPTSTLKLFVQITEGVTAAEGAFRLHDTRSTRRLMRGGFVSEQRITGPARRRVEDPRHVVPFQAPAGWAAFCNTTRCLHRAGVPAEGRSRGMVQITFGPAARTAGPDPFRDLPPDPGVVEGRTA